MRQLIAAFWWWIRVIVLAVAGVYAFMLLWKNSGQNALIWYWPGQPAEQTNIMALTLAAFLSGGLIMTIGWALFTATVNLRRTRAVRRKRAAEMQREEIERKASMLRVKPAPAPIVRVRPTSKPIEPTPIPAVEPMPEPTFAPTPAVVIKPTEPARLPELTRLPEPSAEPPVAIEGKPLTAEANGPEIQTDSPVLRENV